MAMNLREKARKARDREQAYGIREEYGSGCGAWNSRTRSSPAFEHKKIVSAEMSPWCEKWRSLSLTRSSNAHHLTIIVGSEDTASNEFVAKRDRGNTKKEKPKTDNQSRITKK